MKNLSETITNNIKKHLIQPWPYASSIGDEYRDIVTNGDGIYIEDKNGNKLIDEDNSSLKERRNISHHGYLNINIIISKNGKLESRR